MSKPLLCREKTPAGWIVAPPVVGAMMSHVWRSVRALSALLLKRQFSVRMARLIASAAISLSASAWAIEKIALSGPASRGTKPTQRACTRVPLPGELSS